MNDYVKFKKMLAWFVNQLNINNGVTAGEKVTGRGYTDNSSLRKYYEDCRSYDGFELDCTIDHKYGNYATTSNYINLVDTDINTIPEFDKTSNEVISLYIGNHPPEKPIDRKSESISVASLGLYDDEPNQALRDFFNIFKKKILETKNGLDYTIVPEPSSDSLGQILKEMYDSAEQGRQVTSIHLFGIIYNEVIKSSKVSIADIIKKAGLQDSYSAEINKGANIGQALLNDESLIDSIRRSNPISIQETELSSEYFGDDILDELAPINKKEIEALTLNCLGGLKKEHTILKRASLFELNNGKTVLMRQSKLLSTGYFYGLQKAIVDSNEIIDYLVLVKGDEGFYKIPYAVMKELCLDGSISFADKGKSSNEVVKGYRIHLTLYDEKYMLKFPGGKPPMDIDLFFVKFQYTKDDFFSEVYFELDDYDDIVAIINRKKNIIFHGAPGVGKSYMAKRLAYSIIGAKDESKIEMIQFHQNYSYEDFIEGFRPSGNGNFELIKGVFYNFCIKAQRDKSSKYFFIIDEINRGNLSKVMGELMLLLENDKRGNEFAMKLTYSSEMFYVPDNIYVIGMMNTADRSLAMIDYALRRRFSFIPIEPVFDNPQFIADFKSNYHDAEAIIEKIKRLNGFISENLDEGHQIGHSYFCSNTPFSSNDIEGIIKYEIEELLNEYFFDDKDNLEKAKGLLK